MAARKQYKDWSLEDLEAEVAGREAVKQRIPAALKEAVNAARLRASGVPADEAAAQAHDERHAAELSKTAERAADDRRKEFTKRVAQLMDSGFTEGQAVEALSADGWHEEAAEYQPQPTAVEEPPRRDLSDVDQSTGEIRDRPAQPAGPYALVSAIAKPITYYWAEVQICTPTPDGDGETVEAITCDCKYGHEREELALKHARKIAAERGAHVA